MKSTTSIDKFKEGESIQGFFLCFEKHIRHSRNGDLYLTNQPGLGVNLEIEALKEYAIEGFGKP